MKKAAAVSSRNVCFAVRLRKASYKNSTFKLSLSLLAVTMSFWGVSYADDCTDIMNTANDELQNSFAKGNEASAKGDSATALEKKACDSKDPALRAQIDTLRGEQKQLDEQAELFARSALAACQVAQTLRPECPQPRFGEGMALIQLKYYCRAIEKIESARAAGYKTDETTFYLGDALANCSGAGTDELNTGIQLLREYIDKARSNPRLFPNLDAAKRLEKNAKEKGDTLAETNRKKNAHPNATVCPLPAPEKTELPFIASVATGMGYNDNVLSLRNGASLPTGVTQRGSAYNESSFAMSRDFLFLHAFPSADTDARWLSDKLSLQYSLTADTFFELASQDRIAQVAFASYQRSLTPYIAGFIKLSDTPLEVDQRFSSNIFNAQEALVLTPNGLLKTLISYYFIRTDGFAAASHRVNPDGFAHRAEFNQSCIVYQDPVDFSPILTLTGQYAHEWDEPSGFTVRYQRDEIVGKAAWKIWHARTQCAFLRRVTLTLSDTWRSDHYENGSLPLPATSGHRSDDANLAVVSISAPMWYDHLMANAGVPDGNRLEAILEYHYTTRDSNVATKVYDQNFVVASLKLNF